MPERFERLISVDRQLMADRVSLMERQTALLAALVANGPIPAGFDPGLVRAQATALAAKRADTVARVVPEPARILGGAYGPLFLRYARLGPQTGGYRADGLAFAAWALTAEPAAPWRRELEQWLRPNRRRRWPRRQQR